jgi:hypothetical protein
MAAQKYMYNCKVKGRKWFLCSWPAAGESKPGITIFHPQRFLGKNKIERIWYIHINTKSEN